MPIRWSPGKVTEATDAIEKAIAEARPSLELARQLALEAVKGIPDIPGYVTTEFLGVVDVVNYALGGGMHEPEGKLAFRIRRLRDAIPKGSVEEEKKEAENASLPLF